MLSEPLPEPSEPKERGSLLGMPGELDQPEMLCSPLVLSMSPMSGRIPPGDCCACGIRLESCIGVPAPNDGMEVSAPLSLSRRQGESSPPSEGGPPVPETISQQCRAPFGSPGCNPNNLHEPDNARARAAKGAAHDVLQPHHA